MKMMGILNVTPDSFTDGGDYVDMDAAVARALQMVADGADIIDVGGESTHPSAPPISQAEELQRTIPLIEKIAPKIKVPISIDTYKSEVARQAVFAGATMINDIGGAKFDPDMPSVMAESDATLILMHNRKDGNTKYADVVADLKRELQESVDLVLDAGVKPEKIILDPGIGFAKTYDQSVEILQRITELKSLGFPILIGASKKGTIGHLLGGVGVLGRADGTLAVTCYAAQKEIDYIRVHDVLANQHAICVFKKLNEVPHVKNLSK